jgi:hypothetical protein
MVLCNIDHAYQRGAGNPASEDWLNGKNLLLGYYQATILKRQYSKRRLQKCHGAE